MMHHPWSTYPGQHQCGHSICILVFNIKSIRIMISKIYIYYERTLVVPDVVLARWRSGNVFDRPWCFRYMNGKSTVLVFLILLKLKLIYIIVLYTVYFDFMLSYFCISIHHWAYSLLTLLLFSFYRLVVVLCIERRWSSFRFLIVLCLGSWKIVVSTGLV